MSIEAQATQQPSEQDEETTLEARMAAALREIAKPLAKGNRAILERAADLLAALRPAEPVAEVRASGSHACEIFFLPAGINLKPGDKLCAAPMSAGQALTKTEFARMWRAHMGSTRFSDDAWEAKKLTERAHGIAPIPSNG